MYTLIQYNHHSDTVEAVLSINDVNLPIIFFFHGVFNSHVTTLVADCFDRHKLYVVDYKSLSITVTLNADL